MQSEHPILATPAADPNRAADHFASLLEFETDCWDVHEALTKNLGDFVVLDVRSPELYAQGHIAEAFNLPRSRINQRNLEVFAGDATFVVYCAGPHCNGADRAALRLAQLGRPVKKMIGGITGWLDEGFELAKT